MMVGRRGAALRNGAPRGGHDDRRALVENGIFCLCLSTPCSYREKRVLEGDSAIHYPKIGSRVHRMLAAMQCVCDIMYYIPYKIRKST